jgi:fatty-acyl-CoA synthase
LGNIAPLRHEPWSSVADLIDKLAELYENRPALEAEDGGLTYRELSQHKTQYARWALAQDIGAGDTVALLMPNCTAYVAIWCGIAQTGACCALLNTQLAGEVLLQVISTANPRHLVVDTSLLSQIQAIRASLPASMCVWAHGTDDVPTPGIGRLHRTEFAIAPLARHEIRPLRADGTALLIFTSGTTGLPKAARVSHYRVLEWSYWFAGMMDTTPQDRLYNCLPLYHSTGGVAALGGVLVNGGTVVLRRRFSARRFWDDIVDRKCTLFLYIGELCRYLVDSPVHERETEHQLRLCCGNGLQDEVWKRFAARFRPGRILEFYASTEGNVALYNCEGQPGAVGRIPAFLAHRFPAALIACDPVSGLALRDADGRCIPCPADVVGEAIGKIADGAMEPAGFEGYTDDRATQDKILRDVFSIGDRWFRTGDLMRKDAAGFWYFVDRMGDTFRRNGENVSTEQVANIIGSCPGVTGVAVFGVKMAGEEGRAGMAAITIQPGFSFEVLHAHLSSRLPSYARPAFLRICSRLETTGTFKISKATLIREGFGQNSAGDPIYAENASAGTYHKVGGVKQCCQHRPSE